MRLELRGHHVDITPALRRLVGTKLSKLERLLNDSAVSAQAILTREKHRHRADITLHARGEKFLHGLGDTDNWDTSLTSAIDKISQQAQKVKSKRKASKRHSPKAGIVAARENGESAERPAPVKPATPARAGRERLRMPRILRSSRQTIRPMSVADAARQMDAGDDGVVIFRDVETEAVSVLFRHQNGEMTLVETDA
ncbi:MAG: ribosome-associated translation inhibitor RaiA [Acidobacteria bacterium]|nr:MAG: ribosome-associated translation inhibitor RaiA [Acidobacteriota bacterium]PYR16000.1 MAG: ribosome-associated translation inhibitor RaiA [Acidobacteriota bacterium]PYR53291.1 MAG: ribosome-associated translation inhibitor RaiA [Acidobacteriota bacterium]